MEEEKTRRRGLAKAVAIQYDPETDAAPLLTAAGQGYMAEKIVEIAAENDIPIVQDKQAADLLSQLSVGDAIPPELYQVVAEILVFITETDDKAAKKFHL
ncbi:MAG: EscU/YscU/HrcU family type III secretion system export apparatus switch protein [Clostridia bacterium]|nr:EscU/YscU/HrcU family type III secretion system export apparatus switch protein [Clostridia bacterium]